MKSLKSMSFLLLLISLTGIPSTADSEDRVLAVTTDWISSGSLSTLGVEPPWVSNNDVESIHSDATARVHGGMIYVVNRLSADNIQVINPDANFATVQQFSVGAGTNPQDIAVISDTRAYVTLYETNDLLEVNPVTGEHLGTISLAAFADADGLCEMYRMHIDGNYLYVQIQRMYRQEWPDPWIPVPPSYLAVVDLNTRQLVDVDPVTPGMQGIALQGLNPIASMQIDPGTGYLLVPEAGQYTVTDAGGIEAVNLSTWESVGFMTTEIQLGGDPVDFALFTPSKAYAVISDASFNTLLLSFNPATGDVIETMYNPGGYVFSDLMTHHSGHLYLADRDYSTPGIRVFDTATDQLIAGPIDTGLPPFELLLLPGPTSNTPEPPLVSQSARAFPNPSRGAVRIHLQTPAAGTATLDVYDVFGRLIRNLSLPGSTTNIEWDGRDQSGRIVPAGVYHLRIASNSGFLSTQSVRILR